MLFILLVICAVPRTSPRPLLSAAGPTAPYFLTGCCHASSTSQSCRARDSLYSFLAVLVFGVVDFLLPSACSGVVRVERQRPGSLLRFHRLVVLAGLIIAVGLGEQTFHFLDFVDEAGIHRLVEVTGLSHVREKLLRLTAVRVVTG